MKKEITDAEIRKFNQYGMVYTILLTATILSVIPIIIWPNAYVIVCAAALYVVTICCAFKVEKLKKSNDIYTYKEIVAFTDGKRLDELTKQQEIGKRPYQQFLLALGSALIVVVIALIVGFFLH